MWASLQKELGSSGLPVYGVEVKIASIGSPTKICKRGEDGEILVRARSTMLGYLYNKEATAEALDKDGWFYTGDVGRIDRHGHIFITDRMKEVIKVKGLQVSPSDLEATLISSPLISDAAVTTIYECSAGGCLRRCGEACADVEKLAQDVKAWMEERTTQYKWYVV